MERIQSSLHCVLQFLRNDPKGMSNFVHKYFVKEEADNFAFLASRIAMFVPEVNDLALEVVTFASESPETKTSPRLILAQRAFAKKSDLPPACDHDPEFAKKVLTGWPVYATQALVREAFAVWTDQDALCRVINVGLARIESDPQTMTLTKTRKADPHFEGWVDFVMHVVFVATQWGELEKPVGGSMLVWSDLAKKLTAWAVRLLPFVDHNLVLFVQLLVCLDLLSEHECVHNLYTQELFDEQDSTINIYQHPHIFWALFYANRLKKKSC